MHQIRFRLQTPLGELTALSHPVAGFKGLTSKGRGRKRRQGREEKKGEGRGVGAIQFLAL